MEGDAVRAHLGQPVHRFHRIEVGTDDVAEWITPRIPHRPQSEGELVIWVWRVLIRHVGSSRPAGDGSVRKYPTATGSRHLAMVALSGRSGLAPGSNQFEPDRQ